MILKALDTLHISAVSSDNIITGQTFEIDDLGGYSLIERGLAVEVDAKITKEAEAVTPETSDAPDATEKPPIANKASASTRTKAA